LILETMPQYKLRIPVADLDAGRTITGLLNELIEPSALAVTLFEAELPSFTVEAYYEGAPPVAHIERELANHGALSAAIAVEIVPDANWVAISQAALPPIHAGRFTIHGSHDRARVGSGPFAIEIEAGEAFGTGHNATTSGCLEALDALTRQRRFTRVLDLGCGTAVLAIAAARTLPAARVLASDNDPIATEVARHNVRLNRVAARIRVVTAAGLAHPTLRQAQPYDLILANILPRPLIALAPAMRAALHQGGVAVLSGLLNHQAHEVRARYHAFGFHLLSARRHAGWTVLVLQRT
jgi:ribosomal protein L11 methyltransferase